MEPFGSTVYCKFQLPLVKSYLNSRVSKVVICRDAVFFQSNSKLSKACQISSGSGSGSDSGSGSGSGSGRGSGSISRRLYWRVAFDSN